MKNRRNGFTLIELIVTITIIALVSMLAVVNFGSVNKKARDSRRQTDLEKIRTALELAKQVGVTYPATKEAVVSGGYLQSWPKDPKTNSEYFYVRGATGYTYSVGTTLEETNTSYVVTNP